MKQEKKGFYESLKMKEGQTEQGMMDSGYSLFTHTLTHTDLVSKQISLLTCLCWQTALNAASNHRNTNHVELF